MAFLSNQSIQFKNKSIQCIRKRIPIKDLSSFPVSGCTASPSRSDFKFDIPYT